jgi:prepilin-type N-terminal cleavage/methylation domain-containing protein
MRIIKQRTTDGRRAGFTIIEMLIVLTIILILVGLLAAAVVKIMGKGAELQVTSEMSSFAQSIQAFQTEFPAAKYVPSRLLLVEDGNWAAYNGTQYQQLAQDSLAYLQQVFGSRAALSSKLPNGNANPAWPPQGGLGFLDWNNDGSMYSTTSGNTLNPPMILEGQHCLVFLLGGLQAPQAPATFGSIGGTCLGFSTNPTNPTDMTTSSKRGPFFDFKGGRLMLDYRPPQGLSFFVYLDPFNKVSPQPLDGTPTGAVLGNNVWTPVYPKQPYAYFSGYRSANGYNRYVSASFGSLGPDCPSLSYLAGGATAAPPLQPYFNAQAAFQFGNPLFPTVPTIATYMNPSSFQILSAGADGVWGIAPPTVPAGPTIFANSGPWPGANGGGTPGVDDWGNFSRAFLGAPQTN